MSERKGEIKRKIGCFAFSPRWKAYTASTLGYVFYNERIIVLEKI